MPFASGTEGLEPAIRQLQEELAGWKENAYDWRSKYYAARDQLEELGEKFDDLVEFNERIQKENTELLNKITELTTDDNWAELPPRKPNYGIPEQRIVELEGQLEDANRAVEKLVLERAEMRDQRREWREDVAADMEKIGNLIHRWL